MNLITRYILIVWLLSLSFVSHAYNLLILSDPHLDLQKNTPMVLAPKTSSSSNDIDLPTLTTLLSSLAKKITDKQYPTPDALLLLGDTVHHGFWVTTKDKTRTLIAYSEVLKRFFPNTPIVSVFGNNDSLIAHYGPYAPVKASVTDFLIPAQRCLEDKTALPCLLTSDQKLGQFSVQLSPKLRLLGINSVLFSTHRKKITRADAERALNDLNAMLEMAKSDNQQVLIAMHIPVGVNLYDGHTFWLKKPEQRFLNLLQRYRHLIQAVLVAHTHNEEIKLIKDATGIVTAELYTAALSTSHGNVPAAKYVYFKDAKLDDYQTLAYWQRPDGRYEWQTAYHFKQTYCKTGSVSYLQCLKQVNLETMAAYFTLNPTMAPAVVNTPSAWELIIPAR